MSPLISLHYPQQDCHPQIGLPISGEECNIETLCSQIELNIHLNMSIFYPVLVPLQIILQTWQDTLTTLAKCLGMYFPLEEVYQLR